MIGRYNYQRPFWHNVLHYKATNEPRFMLSDEHDAITRIIVMRSVFKLVTGFMVILIMWGIRNA
ncbi:MAG: hypothetical protein EOQ39_18665 [Mesorhizobium sp.]|uniref:hypothetical protein n=1 Tax=Mesorhizobium sp. TaxID=1871066 RepID=UPI000FE753D5|nr:hypothetical protein [Mesorhizobium sp.]RWB08806.1 MAG: hypothetical protein EOQ37_04675 [Mesorhizobium sp.]RWB13543.1 MAG: hypothetical protein EOQ39_18665 [Mesorhizobium sp.]